MACAGRDPVNLNNSYDSGFTDWSELISMQVFPAQFDSAVLLI